ncbi:phage portal protein, lambda family [Rhizobium sp. CF080]|uniref:phage portal protein n=1 Tax=Rhizobium sp. (strain CF080) TaxID=1144310 RepID=UPI000271CD32|nr:phage portal protein [Rhizobium sp. CF080]EUB97297.1 phage portal protein, lambda family [Rhizobium sp. CF080]
MVSNFLDRTIGFFSPEKGAKRVAARKRMELLDGIRAYEGASNGRLAQNWLAPRGDANGEISRAGATLRDRSRDAVRNHPLAAKIVTIHANNFVGFGITPQFKTGDPDRDKKLTELFDEWSKVCHVDGSTDFYGLTYLLARMMVQDGELYIRKRTRLMSDGLPVPLQLQVLDSEFCDWSKSITLEGNRIINGIEYDAIGRRRGYWLYPQNPLGSYSFGGTVAVSGFVPATDVAHIFEPQTNQIHGVPWLAPILTELKDLRDYELAENIRKKVEACSVGTVVLGDTENDDDPNVGITVPDPPGEGKVEPAVTDVYGNPMERMEPGMFHILTGGKDIKFNTPAISAGMEAYLRTRHRSIAAGARVTYELMTGDFSQANFASGKLGLLEYQRFVGHVQWHILIPQALDKIGAWFIEAAKLAGKLPANVAVKIEWTPPEVESITRLDDARADLLEVRMGKRSMPEIIAKTGRDPATVLKETDEWSAKVDATATKLILDSDPRKVTIQGQLQMTKQDGDNGETDAPSS